MITELGKIFKIEYGQKEYENKESLEGDFGNNILISSKGEDNGVFGFFDIKNGYEAPFITVPRVGTIGQAFVQETDCSVDNNCMVLIPLKKMKIEELFQISFQIRLTKWKYRYGRQITPERLGRERIKIENFNINYSDYIKELVPKEKEKVGIKENKNMKWVSLTDLCMIERKTALPQNSMDKGKTPYITTSSKDNGLTDFVSEEPNTEAKCLTVALNGSCGQTFFQFNDFITSGDNAILRLRGAYNPYLLFYIGFQIYRQRWGFNYYRKLSETRLRKMKIPIPFLGGEYDIKYIESLVKNCYGFDKIKNYI